MRGAFMALSVSDKIVPCSKNLLALCTCITVRMLSANMPLKITVFRKSLIAWITPPMFRHVHCSETFDEMKRLFASTLLHAYTVIGCDEIIVRVLFIVLISSLKRG